MISIETTASVATAKEDRIYVIGAVATAAMEVEAGVREAEAEATVMAEATAMAEVKEAAKAVARAGVLAGTTAVDKVVEKAAEKAAGRGATATTRTTRTRATRMTASTSAVTIGMTMARAGWTTASTKADMEGMVEREAMTTLSLAKEATSAEVKEETGTEVERAARRAPGAATRAFENVNIAQYQWDDEAKPTRQLSVNNIMRGIQVQHCFTSLSLPRIKIMTLDGGNLAARKSSKLYSTYIFP